MRKDGAERRVLGTVRIVLRVEVKKIPPKKESFFFWNKKGGSVCVSSGGGLLGGESFYSTKRGGLGLACSSSRGEENCVFFSCVPSCYCWLCFVLFFETE